ncbi:MAG TPA: DNA primase [Tepidisphaeraceae bacterium]|nr:DNA primase [Tepidisphaeraceae bacterium]
MRARVLEATNIVELIGHSVNLKRAGRKYVGLCPFHQEKTPSFNVDPTKQFFYCFGCKKAGNAIDFLIARDRIEFKDALRQLAEAAGIELPVRLVPARRSGSELEILRDANAAACQFFEKLLALPEEGRAARDYLKSRGFTDESVTRFRIGLAPDAWDGFARSSYARKFTPEQLAVAGLLKPREAGGGHYDTFRNRLMFPIRDIESRVIAFGGRVMPGSEDKAKYLNSPETPLFEKGRVAFGLDLARNRVVETRTVAVVEGYTDVVMAHQCGCTNVVSTLGTAMTPQHVSLLRRFADRIVLLFDPDLAGDTAVDRAVELFLTQDKIDIAVATLPDGLDPDEFLLKHGAAAFDAVIAQATDALAFKWKQLMRRHHQSEGDLSGQQRAVEEYLGLLAQARGNGSIDPLRWGGVLARVNRLTQIPVADLHRRFAKSRQPRRTAGGEPGRTVLEKNPAAAARSPGSGQPSTPPMMLTARDRAETTLLGVLLAEPRYWPEVQKHIAVGDFSDESRRRLAEIYWQHQRDEGEPILNQFLSLLDEEIKELAVRLADEASCLDEMDSWLNSSLEYFDQEKRRREGDKIHAAASAANSDDAAEWLKKLSAARQTPDLRRNP